MWATRLHARLVCVHRRATHLHARLVCMHRRATHLHARLVCVQAGDLSAWCAVEGEVAMVVSGCVVVIKCLIHLQFTLRKEYGSAR